LTDHWFVSYKKSILRSKKSLKRLNHKKEKIYSVFHQFGQAKLSKFDFKLQPIFATAPAASKFDAGFRFKNSQN
jgi:hypothetical protein